LRFHDGDFAHHAQLAFSKSGGKSIYVAVDDADKLYARAKTAGATIEEELTDRDYGSREFICRDPEGNVWSFGTYWPKANEPAV
jgi:uncharacterized glyoxalase superfamily protein PhnB